ncbi:DUF4340 domain-containing protein [bacterium]|nr:DUF4340 domain-containing protein [bacterium]
MKKSNIILLALLIVGTVVFFIFKNRDRSNNMAIKADYFQVKDTQSVSRIFITDINGNKVTLDRKGHNWLVNDKFTADRSAIDNLFEPLTKMRIKATVSDNDKDEMIKEMTVGHRKVEVYKNGELDRVLFVGNATADGLGTYMYAEDEGLERPYIVHIPGWNGNLGPRFFTDERSWRSLKVFAFNPVSIEYLQVQFSNPELTSYRLVNEGKGKTKVINLSNANDSLVQADDNKVKEVFMNCGKMYFESYIKSSKKGLIDSVYETIPVYASIEVKVQNQDPQLLILKEFPADEKLAELDPNMLIDRFYAYFDGEAKPEVAVLQRGMAAKLLKNFDRFEKSN